MPVAKRKPRAGGARFDHPFRVGAIETEEESVKRISGSLTPAAPNILIPPFNTSFPRADRAMRLDAPAPHNEMRDCSDSPHLPLNHRT